MQAGDFVVMIAQARMVTGSSQTQDVFNINGDGGQGWSKWQENYFQPSTGNVTTNISGVFYARFNGTWSGTLSLTVAGLPVADTNDPVSIIMLNFRPTTSTNFWTMDTLAGWVGYAAPSSPFTITVSPGACNFANSVSLAMIQNSANVTYSSLAGSGWSQTGLSTQYVNSSGFGAQSTTVAYNIRTSAGTPANASLNENASTTAVSWTGCFAEYAPPSGGGGGSTGFIQSCSNGSAGSGVSLTCSFSSAVVNGHAVVCGFNHEANAQEYVRGLSSATGPHGVSDDATGGSNQYYILGNWESSDFTQNIYIAAAINVSGSPKNITITNETGATISVVDMGCIEYDNVSGFEPTNTFGSFWAPANGLSTQDYTTIPCRNPSQAGSILIGAGELPGTAGTLSIPTGNTGITCSQGGTGSSTGWTSARVNLTVGLDFIMTDQILTSASSKEFIFHNVESSGGEGTAVMAVLKKSSLAPITTGVTIFGPTIIFGNTVAQ